MYRHEPIGQSERRFLETLLEAAVRPAPADHYGDPHRGYAKGMLDAAQALCDAMLQANATEPYVHESYHTAETALKLTMNTLLGHELADIVLDVMRDGDHIVKDAMRWVIDQNKPLPHEELRTGGELTLCDDPGCSCRSMAIDAEAGGFRWVYDPELISEYGGGYQRIHAS